MYMPTTDATYVRPQDVHSPKSHWTLVHVLFDGGENDGKSAGNSLAIGRWDSRHVLAMRWNGNGENPIGNPQSRGLPTWFIVPQQHWNQILETGPYNFSDDKINFARRFLESERIFFFTHCRNRACPNYGGLVLAEYRMNEIDDILKDLERDELKFYHIICDGLTEPTSEEKTQLTAILKAAQRLRFEIKVSLSLAENGMVECRPRYDWDIEPRMMTLPMDQLPRQLKALGYGASDDQITTANHQLSEFRLAELWIPKNTSKFSALG
jgi:hypothetical protein